MRHELTGWTTRSWCEQADSFRMMVLHQAHRFGNVAVVADDHCTVVDVKPAVIKQMHDEFNVRALFLGLDHFSRTTVVRAAEPAVPEPCG